VLEREERIEPYLPSNGNVVDKDVSGESGRPTTDGKVIWTLTFADVYGPVRAAHSGSDSDDVESVSR
jgi:hypothetical protein